MGNPVVHWEIGAKDAKKLQDFYSNLFDWKLEVDETLNYGMLNAGTEEGIAGGIFPTQGGMPTYFVVYAQVDDVQASLDKAESLGGKAITSPTPIPNVGSFATFADPEGNTFGLFKGEPTPQG